MPSEEALAVGPQSGGTKFLSVSRRELEGVARLEGDAAASRRGQPANPPGGLHELGGGRAQGGAPVVASPPEVFAASDWAAAGLAARAQQQGRGVGLSIAIPREVVPPRPAIRRG